MNPTLQAALEYAERGWPVLPLSPRTKVPLAKSGGVDDATTDPVRIREWFDEHPDRNIAIATGAPGPDVVDLDDLARAESAGTLDLVRAAPHVRSSRGYHFYFAGTGGRTIDLGYGEIRRRGSYVIAPPSVHPSGERYEWIGLPGAGLPPLAVTIVGDRSSAGAGEAPVVEVVPPGAMYGYLLDLAVRMARTGERDADVVEGALLAAFSAKRDSTQDYGDADKGAKDTRRLAEWAVGSEIAQREGNDAYTPPPMGGSIGEAESEAFLTFHTPAELRENIPEAPPWIWENYIAAGFITVVGGRPKVGKSTMVYEAIDRIARGDEMFLGGPITPTDIVVISEEHAITALDKLSDSDRLHVVTRDFAWPLPTWEVMLRDGLAEAKRTGAKLILIDSFTFWAGMASEAGQDAGAVQAQFRSLMRVAREGIGVVLIHHQRKGGGEYGEALLGSTAFAANADIILEVERLGQGPPPNYRRVMRAARWHGHPATITSWTPGAGYEFVAYAEDADEATDLGWKHRLESELQGAGSVRATQLDVMVGADNRSWGRAMASLIESGRVVRTGAGGVKDPVTYTAGVLNPAGPAPAI